MRREVLLVRLASAVLLLSCLSLSCNVEQNAYAWPLPLPTRAGAPQLLSGTPPAGLELHISGPSELRRNRNATFKAVLSNHTAAPLLIGPPERSHSLVFSTWWSVTSESGGMLKPRVFGYCPVDGMDYSRKWPLSDNAIRILQPGESVELQIDADPRGFVIFPKSGTFQVTLNYSFRPPSWKRSTNGKVELTNFDIAGLSAKNVAALEQAQWLSAISNTMTVVLR